MTLIRHKATILSSSVSRRMKRGINHQNKNSSYIQTGHTDDIQDWKQCPDVLNGGKPTCKGDECDCLDKFNEVGCMLGICVCLHESHLAFNKIECHDTNHPNILRNATHRELQCPRTCSPLSEFGNTCPFPSKKKEDGRCYCADDSLVVPQFTADHRLNTTALCSHSPVTPSIWPIPKTQPPPHGQSVRIDI